MSMNHVTPPAELAREPMRWQVKFALSFVTFATLFVLWAWLEHERAKAGLAAYRQQLVASGEKLDLKDHIPPMPKPEENAAPDLIAAAATVRDQPWDKRAVGIAATASSGRARVAWQQAELPNADHPDVWPDVIVYLEEHRETLLAAAKALERPRWGVAMDYYHLDKEGGFAHLTLVRRLAMAQAEAVIADLHSDRKAEAYTNLLAVSRLVQRLDEPLIFSQLTRYSIAITAVTATWEALQMPGWTEGQLAELQLNWERTEPLKSFAAAAELERCGIPAWFAKMRSEPTKLREELAMIHGGGGSAPPSLWDELWEHLFNDPSKTADAAQAIWRFGVWPAWNSYRDERHYFAALQPWIELDRATLRSPNTFAASARIEALTKSQTPAPESWLVSKAFPGGLQHYRQRMAMFETVRRVMITALALERYRVKHGNYPETLAALVPTFLREVPVDFQDAKPLRYRREANGEFKLWSVGENGTDENGNDEFPAAATATPIAPVAPVAVRPTHWLRDRDLLWPRAASEAEVTALHSGYAAERAKKAKP